MSYSAAEIWLIIALLGLGTFLIRFSFLGIIGGRNLPEWVLRYLRYTPVAVLPGLVAPLVLWPQATGGDPDAPRLMAAAVTLGLGVWTHNILLSISCGAAILFAAQYLIGG